MRFEHIVGQSDSQERLRLMVQQDRLPHALLLLGPEGSGQLALAVATAQYLLCNNRSQNDACGVCTNCRKTEQLIHPDLHFSFPTVGTKAVSDQFMKDWRSGFAHNPYLNANQWLQHIGAENRQGNITKEECVAIIKKLSLKTFEADAKVMILWLPEYLAKEGNRLLKIIEEPPPDTFFILVAQSAEKILNTILSRCQLIKIPPLTDQDILKGIQNKYPNLDEQAEVIVHLSNGNFNAALSLAQEQGTTYNAIFLDWMRKTYKGNGIELVKWSDEFSRLGRENQKHYLLYGLHFLRELTVLMASGDTENIRLPKNDNQAAIKLSKILNLDQIDLAIALFNTCYQHIERNANPKILMTNAGIRLHQIMRKKQPDFQATT